jgi:hypothetical protein
MRTLILLILMLFFSVFQMSTGAALPKADTQDNWIPLEGQDWDEYTPSMDGVFFDAWEKQGHEQTPMGVFYYEFSTQNTYPILAEGYVLQDVSPDESWLLANKGESLRLYSLLGSKPTLISDAFLTSYDGSTALFKEDQTFVYIQQQNNQVDLLQYDITNSRQSTWLDEDILPLYLQHGVDDGIWIFLRPCQTSKSCTANEERWLINDNNQQTLAVDAEQFWPATGTDSIAYANPSINPSLVYFADTLGFSSEQLRLAGSYTLNASWHPDGRHIAVLQLKRDFDTHEVSGIRQHIIDTQTLSVSEYASLNGLLAQAIWLDDDTLLVLYTQENAGMHQLGLALTHLQDGSVQQLPFESPVQSEKMVFVRQIIGLSE